MPVHLLHVAPVAYKKMGHLSDTRRHLFSFIEYRNIILSIDAILSLSYDNTAGRVGDYFPCEYKGTGRL